MNNTTFKSGLRRIAVILLALITVSVLVTALVGCNMKPNDGNVTPDNNDNSQNQNDQNNTPDNGNTDMGTDVSPNGTPNSLSGKTAEGQIYHIINSGSSSTPFMMVTKEGKHYYVNNTQTSNGRSSGEDSNENGSGMNNGSSSNGNAGNGTSSGGNTGNSTSTDGSNGGTTGEANGNQNGTPNTGNGNSAQGGSATFELGDKVRIDITEGTDNGTVCTVNDCKVTLIEKFQGTLLNAKVYTKDGIPAEMLTTEDETSRGGWYHQKFDDYSDYDMFLSRYGLKGYIEGMYSALSDGTVNSIDEEFFKNNSIHIFAVPYSGGESMTEADDATLYKSGDTLCLMVKEGGYVNYLSGLVGMGRGLIEGVGDAVKDGAKAIGDAAKDITNGIGDTAKDIANGAGNGAKNGTDGSTGRNSRNNEADGVNDGINSGSDGGNGTNNGGDMGTDNGTHSNDENNGTHANNGNDGIYCRFYVVLLGEEGRNLDNGAVLISDRQ